MNSVIIDIQCHLDIDNLHDTGGLSAKICLAMIQNDKIILTSKGEGFNFKSNGLYDLLDSVCEVMDFDPSKITLQTWNLLESHDRYDVQCQSQIFDTGWFVKYQPVSTPNQDKILLMMGRSNEARLKAHELVSSISWRDKLLYSFHMDMSVAPWGAGMRDRISAGSSYDFFKRTTPCSDISVALKTPIIPPHNIQMLHPVYDKIALEIVVETVTDEGFFVTEKTLRPIWYGRPFLAVGPPGYEDNLRKLGFNLDFGFPGYLENFGHLNKVDEIFKFLSTKWEYSEDWFNSLLPVLEHNQETLSNIAKKNGKIDLNLFQV